MNRISFLQLPRFIIFIDIIHFFYCSEYYFYKNPAKFKIMYFNFTPNFPYTKFMKIGKNCLQIFRYLNYVGWLRIHLKIIYYTAIKMTILY